MKYSTIFHLIADIFKRTQVSCILIGGFAVNFYKVTRQTMDVDFLIRNEDFDKILPYFEMEGFQCEYREKVFAKLRGNKIYLMSVDFMFVDNETFNMIVKDGKETEMAGEKFIVPSLYHLIALKLHAIKQNPKFRMVKDLMDIVNLVQLNKVEVTSGEFKELCLKYGTEDIYNKILEFFK